MMTRKDYVATAEILSNYSLGIDSVMFSNIVNDFAEMFEKDNERFDADRFIDAAMTIGGSD